MCFVDGSSTRATVLLPASNGSFGRQEWFSFCVFWAMAARTAPVEDTLGKLEDYVPG